VLPASLSAVLVVLTHSSLFDVIRISSYDARDPRYYCVYFTMSSKYAAAVHDFCHNGACCLVSVVSDSVAPFVDMDTFAKPCCMLYLDLPIFYSIIVNERHSPYVQHNIT
jgi:hypothetical protein